MAINGNINLLKYNGAQKVKVNGKKGIFIPVDDNPTIFVGDKGAYASVRIVEHPSDFGDKHYTHFIAASLDKKKKDELEKTLGKDAVKGLTPILGNASDYSASRDSEADYQEVETQEETQTETTGEPIDDMPF